MRYASVLHIHMHPKNIKGVKLLLVWTFPRRLISTSRSDLVSIALCICTLLLAGCTYLSNSFFRLVISRTVFIRGMKALPVLSPSPGIFFIFLQVCCQHCSLKFYREMELTKEQTSLMFLGEKFCSSVFRML